MDEMTTLTADKIESSFEETRNQFKEWTHNHEKNFAGHRVSCHKIFFDDDTASLLAHMINESEEVYLRSVILPLFPGGKLTYLTEFNTNHQPLCVIELPYKKYKWLIKHCCIECEAKSLYKNFRRNKQMTYDLNMDIVMGIMGASELYSYFERREKLKKMLFQQLSQRKTLEETYKLNMRYFCYSSTFIGKVRLIKG